MSFCIDFKELEKFFDKQNLSFEKDFTKCEYLIKQTEDKKVILVFNPNNNLSRKKAEELLDLFENAELKEGYFIKSKRIVFSIFKINPHIVVIFIPEKQYIKISEKLINRFLVTDTNNMVSDNTKKEDIKKHKKRRKKKKTE